MYLNQFSVRVPQGREVSGGYVELDHNTQYTLRLRNSRSVRCNAHVEVDGKHVGTWRLHPNESMELERPAHDLGMFTFYKVGTDEAFQAEAGNVAQEKRGLISVTFTPEQKVRPLGNDSALRNSNWHYYYPGTGGTGGTSGSAFSSMTYTDGNTAPLDASRTAEPKTVRYSTDPVISVAMAATAPSATPGVTGLSGESDQRFVDAEYMPLDLTQATVINLRLVCKDNTTPRPLTQFSTPIPPSVK